MGGELKVESEIGKGSCFYFELNLPVDETANSRIGGLQATKYILSLDLYMTETFFIAWQNI
ncbi:hypothetical protein A9Q81_25080 [Gammaproteobacteria bacterium 42_54_T18]|nr:hypothetical protein A9Q81_25080 [Gammaproteobacteria bacterium 42_54_T18]